MKFHKFKEYPWYTILFAVYPMVTLLGNNIGKMDYSDTYRSFWVSGLISVLLVFFFYLIYRDYKISGILTTLYLFGFFLYRDLYNHIRGFEVNEFVIGRNSYFLPLWLILLIVLTWVILRIPKIYPVLSSFLAIVAVIFLASPVFQIISRDYRYQQNGRLITPVEIPLPQQSVASYPDIYLIILDMYGRDDVLLEDFHHDNSAFTRELQEMGFYVAECSQSNYSGTQFSLSSALNINYLSEISERFSPGNTDTTFMWHLIQNSGVEKVLTNLGYKTVAFKTGYRWTELQDADHYLSFHSNEINDFEVLLLKSVLPSIVLERGLIDRYQLTSDKYRYDLAMNALNELENIPSLDGPKFVFFHLTIPHPPFIVGPTGEFEVVSSRYENNESFYIENEYKTGYINQVKYLNSRLPQILKTILERSERPPIIIVQGDHGPRFVEIEDQLKILNAYYFPEPAPEPYPSISPVNTFRTVFNTYFGTSLPIIPDQSYASRAKSPFEFKEIPNDCVMNID